MPPPPFDYLLTEDGFHFLLEDGSGALLLESSPDLGLLTRATQVAVEAFVGTPATARFTQIGLEVFVFLPVPTRHTQAVVELWNGAPARAQMTQEIVEVFVALPPCVNGDLPVDDAEAGGSCPAPILP